MYLVMCMIIDMVLDKYTQTATNNGCDIVFGNGCNNCSVYLTTSYSVEKRGFVKSVGVE